jgi:hypothetical protein
MRSISSYRFLSIRKYSVEQLVNFFLGNRIKPRNTLPVYYVTVQLITQKNKKMKTLFTLSTLVTMAITGIVSCRLFQHAHYNVSALLIVVSFLSISLWVAVMSSKKILS